MEINENWLDEKGACEEGKSWVLSQSESNPIELLEKLIAGSHWNWANWGITKILSHKHLILYSCYSALQVLKNFEKVYPKDKRLRKAILAATRFAKNPTNINRSAAVAAESAAWSAAVAAESAAAVARSAAWSAAWRKMLTYALQLLKQQLKGK